MKRRSEKLERGEPECCRRPRDFKHRRRAVVTLLIGLFVFVLLRFGGYLLVVNDPLPEHADIAIVLHGSEWAASARLRGAMELLDEGRVSRVVVSVGAISYYGEWVPDMLRSYVAREYGSSRAEKVVLCEGLAGSTVAEMTVLQGCIEAQPWKPAIVVTSDFHTRRTKMTLSATLAGHTSIQRFDVHGVSDGSYSAGAWWKKRQYAKTWFLEMMKLTWFLIEWVLPGGPG